MSNYLPRAKELFPQLVEDRRQIHRHPELGLDTAQTAAYVEKKLEEMGITPKRVGGNGLVATLGKPGKTILLRADMDALPMQEESGLDFASENAGVAHCCGHDLHTAMLLGAARLLKENEGELAGTVKLMFQPGEETLLGARAMIDDGLLENPAVDAAVAVHVNAFLQCGAMLVFQGALSASCDSFTLRVKGHGGHGARPHEAIDPINAACHIHTALQELQAREVPSGETAVLTIGAISGGSTFNVIPETVEMKGTIRTHNAEVQTLLKKRLEEISAGIAGAFRAEAGVEYEAGYTVPLVCDDALAASVKTYLNAMAGRDIAVNMRKPAAASEDFAFVAQRVPASFITLGATVEKGVEFGQHHPKVRYDESCMPLGAAAYAQVATQWLQDNKEEL